MDAKAAVIGLGLTGAVAAGLYLLYRKDQEKNKGKGDGSGTGSSGNNDNNNNNNNNNDNNTTPTTPNTNPNSNEGQVQTNKSKLNLSWIKWISNSYGTYYTGLKVYDGSVLQKLGISTDLYPLFADPTVMPFIKAQSYSFGDIPYASTLFPDTDIYAYFIFKDNPFKIKVPEGYPVMSANFKHTGYYLPMYWEAVNTGNLYISDGSDVYALPYSGISTSDPTSSLSPQSGRSLVASDMTMFLQVFYEKLFGLKSRFTNYPIFPYIRMNQADELVDWDSSDSHHLIILGPLRSIERQKHTFKKEDIHGYLQNQRQLPIQLKINGNWYTGWFNAATLHWNYLRSSGSAQNLEKHDGVATVDAYIMGIAGSFNPNVGNDLASAFTSDKIKYPSLVTYLKENDLIHNTKCRSFVSKYVLSSATPVQGGLDWYLFVYGNKSTSQNTYDPMLYGGMI